MNKAQLHLTNFLLLVEEAGSLTKLARACGYENSASLSQLKRRLEQQAGDESARGIRPSLAAKLESGMRKRKGWLNRDHSKDQEKAAAVEAARLENKLSKQSKLVFQPKAVLLPLPAIPAKLKLPSASILTVPANIAWISAFLSLSICLPKWRVMV